MFNKTLLTFALRITKIASGIENLLSVSKVMIYVHLMCAIYVQGWDKVGFSGSVNKS